MRSSGGVRRHSGKAAAATSTAALTSSAPPSGTVASISPVAGLMTSRHSVACESAHWPLMYWVSLLAGGAATVIMIPLQSRRVPRRAPTKQRVWPIVFYSDIKRAFLPRSQKQDELRSASGYRPGPTYPSSHQLRDHALLIAYGRDCGLQHIERLVHLLIGDHERHQHANHVGIRAGRNRDQAVLVAVLHDLLGLVTCGSLGLIRLHKFDGLHATEAAYIANHRPAPLPLAGAALEAVAKFVGARQQILALE